MTKAKAVVASMADAQVCKNSGIRENNLWTCGQVYIPFIDRRPMKGFCPWCVWRTINRHEVNRMLVDKETVAQACEDQQWLRT